MSEDENLPNSRLPPLEYISQLSEIPNESAEFKQTKGMFKNMGRFLGKLKKKIDRQWERVGMNAGEKGVFGLRGKLKQYGYSDNLIVAYVVGWIFDTMWTCMN